MKSTYILLGAAIVAVMVLICGCTSVKPTTFKVTDFNGAPISGASLLVHNATANITLTNMTDETGNATVLLDPSLTYDTSALYGGQVVNGTVTEATSGTIQMMGINTPTPTPTPTPVPTPVPAPANATANNVTATPATAVVAASVAPTDNTPTTSNVITVANNGAVDNSSAPVAVAPIAVAPVAVATT